MEDFVKKFKEKANLIFYSLVMAVFCFYSCASNPQKNAEGNIEEKTEAANLVSVVLESNPTTGCSWKAEIADEKIAVLESDRYVQDEAEPGMTGVGGVQTLTFKILKEGKTEITLVYGRHWKGGEIYERRMVLLLADRNLNGKIEALNSEITD